MADPLVPEVKPRGFFTEEGPTEFGTFATDLLGAPPTRDFAAERAALTPERAAVKAERKAAVGAVTAEVAKQESEGTTEAAQRAKEREAGRAERDVVTRKMTEHAAPTITARPFLAPGAGILNQLQAALTGVTAMATQMRGLSGSAIPAMAAMKGLAEGFAKGDRERIDNEWAAWQAANDKLIAAHKAAVEKYRDLVEDQRMSAAEKALMRSQRLKGLEFLAGEKAIDAQDIEAQLRELARAEESERHFTLTIKKLDEHHAEWFANQKRLDEVHKDNIQQRVLDRAARGGVVDLQLMRGGPWVVQQDVGDFKRGQIVDNLTRGEWNEAGGHAAFKVLGGGKNTVQAIDIIESEGFPAIEALKESGAKILARYPGQNLAQLLKNYAAGKLSDSDVKEYDQARRALTFSLGRSMTGTPALRKFALQALEEAEVATKGDTKKTMDRMAENSRVVMINFIRGQKGMPAFPYPMHARSVEAVNEKGEFATIKLAPYEPLPAGWRYHY